MDSLGIEELIALAGMVLLGVASFAISGWWGLLGFVGGLMMAGALVLAWLRGRNKGR